MDDRQLRSALIRLAHSKAELRPHLVPLLKQAGTVTSLSMVEDIERKGLETLVAAKEAYAVAIREADAANTKAKQDFEEALVAVLQSTTGLQWRIVSGGGYFSKHKTGVHLDLDVGNRKNWTLLVGERNQYRVGVIDRVQDIATAVHKTIVDSLG